ncbi:MAG: thioredoxin fold domain-containing protein [Thermotogota bacterium]|nr:thioredoxin fold domain-containing protein [Thermotogota bacterium]
MKKFLLILLLVTMSFIGFAYEGKLNNLETALKLASLEKKTAIIMFSDKSCYYCNVFNEKTLTDKNVQQLLKAGYTFIEIYKGKENVDLVLNGETKTYTYSELYSVFGISGTPTLWFLNSAGNPITNLPGYVPADMFVKVLQYLGEEAYRQEIIFESYSKQEHDYIGDSQIITLNSEKANYVLDNDPLAKKYKGDFDRFTIWIVEDENTANTLIEKSAFRVILIKG